MARPNGHERPSLSSGELPSTTIKEIEVPPEYEAHPLLLYFLDPDTEQRYFNFQYVDYGFVSGKVFGVMWTSVSFLSFVYFTAPENDKGAYMVESFQSVWWIGAYISLGLNGTLTLAMFISCLKRYREVMHLLQLFIGWPAFVVFFLIVKRPATNVYIQVVGSFFSFLIAQARLCHTWPLVVFWPVVCLFVVSFSVPAYWRDHTKIEMLYWCFTPIPLCLLAFLERRTRRSFMERELAQEAIAESEHKTAMTQQMIVRYFPATPTRDLLHDAAGRRSKPYPDTVIVVTDIAGFTAFTSRSDPGDVIAMVTSMFHAFDTTAEFHGVEKVATVGDSYCGALFPGVCDSAGRCVNAVQFACASLGFAG